MTKAAVKNIRTPKRKRATLIERRINAYWEAEKAHSAAARKLGVAEKRHWKAEEGPDTDIKKTTAAVVKVADREAAKASDRQYRALEKLFETRPATFDDVFALLAFQREQSNRGDMMEEHHISALCVSAEDGLKSLRAKGAL